MHTINNVPQYIFAHQKNNSKKIKMYKKSQPAFMQNYALEMNLLLII